MIEMTKSSRVNLRANLAVENEPRRTVAEATKGIRHVPWLNRVTLNRRVNQSTRITS